MKTTIYNADCRDVLLRLPEKSIQTCITSPPYWKKRDYGDGGLGTEKSVNEYVSNLTEVFRHVKYVLADDGILWVNIADTYVSSRTPNKERIAEKNLALVPDRFAIAMQDDGWFVRQRIIWRKTNAPPETCTDRFTNCHEYLFMFTKREKYKFFPIIEDAIRPTKNHHGSFKNQGQLRKPNGRPQRAGRKLRTDSYDTRNKRDVWDLSTASSKTGHTAAFPLQLPWLCIKASTEHRDVVLDPFSGSGSTCMSAQNLGRDSIGIEQCPDQSQLSAEWLETNKPLWGSVEIVRNDLGVTN